MKQSRLPFNHMMTRRAVVRLTGGVVLASVGLAACGSSSRASSRTVTPSIPQVLAPGGTLERYVQHLANQDQFSGTILVAKGVQPVLLKAYGQA
ncbi:MAG TPA: hypothetical protein VN729_10180, partial [Ktedonobacteraceae bacterium]|nr:hypothetical protein [Ktedonobacteraceae bacterium]